MYAIEGYFEDQTLVYEKRLCRSIKKLRNIMEDEKNAALFMFFVYEAIYEKTWEHYKSGNCISPKVLETLASLVEYEKYCYPLHIPKLICNESNKLGLLSYKSKIRMDQVNIIISRHFKTTYYYLSTLK
jgi:hypothetical protein